MNVYTNKTFAGFWPVGASAVVVARTPEDAAMRLQKHLGEHCKLGQVISARDMT